MARIADLDPVLADLDARVRAALAAAGLPDGDPDFERPKQAEHGDWATTLALRLAKPARKSPRDIAAAIVEHIELPDAVTEIDVAGPGFINFRLSPAHHAATITRILSEGELYGRRTRTDGSAERVNGEFVSANPTGPLHVGAGRWVATGDAIASLLEADGHEVTREYYLNDAGNQIEILGETVLAVANDRPLEDHHYQGDYIADLVADLRADLGDKIFDADQMGEDHAMRVGKAAAARMTKRIKAQLQLMHVDFDVWFSEGSLHRSGAVQTALDELTASGRVYEQDGALFMRTSEFGDDKDRVVRKSDGVTTTYFAADCAYMKDKWDRGFNRLIYLLGADHHGYVGRLQALAQCLDIPLDRLEIRIGQFVKVERDGVEVKLSKRAGNIVTIDDVVAEVGPDLARYHFLRAGLDTTLTFDLAKVADTSTENPVFYLQYAFARISQLVVKAEERGFDPGDPTTIDLSVLDDEFEQALLKGLGALPLVVADAAEARAAQRLAHWLEELAGTFHRFYTECPVLRDDVDPARAQARYWLAVAAQQVLANALGILGVSTPEQM